MKLLVATRSAGKMREIRRILASVPKLEVVGLVDAGIPYDVQEEGLEPFDTFEQNAESKARYFHERSGLPTVADDSGIEVDALGGAPGVRSKRFAPDAEREDGGLEGRELDHANNRYLVSRLEGVAPAERTARYVCVAVFLEEGRPPLTIRGEAPGVIVDDPSGSRGFGYDPHVFDPTLGKTFAEMTPEEKDVRSHRGHAFRALGDELRRRLGPGDAAASGSTTTPGGAPGAGGGL